MRHGSLFSGIGGFDLAAQWMGWENVFQVEIDPFCQAVLKKHFPNTARYGDIKEFDGTRYRGAIDILSGGFPCQPFSSSGLRKGTGDNRYLWPEMLRVIGEVQPDWVVAENVYGLINWSEGLVFERVQTDLESKGYQVLPNILPACGVDAPHGRERIWFIAHAKVKRGERLPSGKKEKKPINAITGHDGIASNTNRKYCALSVFKWRQVQIGHTNTDRTIQCRPTSYTAAFRRVQSQRRNTAGVNNKTRKAISWERFPTQSPIRDGNDGLPTRLVRHSIAGGGNAIVPALAFEIFKAIEATMKTEG